MKNQKRDPDSVIINGKIHFNSHHGQVTIDIEKILFCEADGNYTKVLSEDNNSIVISKSLCEFEIQLKSHDYLRCHYSYLVNSKKIESICSRKRFVIVAGHNIPVSRRKCNKIFRILMDLGIKETKIDDQIINILTS